MDKDLGFIRPFRKEFIPAPQRLDNLVLPEGPIDLEIGCGVGLHPIIYSQKQPERTLIAIEHTKIKFEKLLRRYHSHHSPKNLIPLHCNAISWIVHCLPPEKKLEKVFLLYPNPKPKSRKKRWYMLPFMEVLIKAMNTNGELIIATNIEDYYLEAKYILTKYWKLSLLEDKVLKDPSIYRTHFEKKYLERGDKCFNLIFQKRF